MESGLCDPKVTKAEKVGGFGALEVYDAHFGVGPLIAEQMTARAIELAKAHGIACVALRNNSHWLRAGRYGLTMADAAPQPAPFVIHPEETHTVETLVQPSTPVQVNPFTTPTT